MDMLPRQLITMGAMQQFDRKYFDILMRVLHPAVHWKLHSTPPTTNPLTRRGGSFLPELLVSKDPRTPQAVLTPCPPTKITAFLAVSSI